MLNNKTASHYARYYYTSFVHGVVSDVFLTVLGIWGNIYVQQWGLLLASYVHHTCINSGIPYKLLWLRVTVVAVHGRDQC